MHRGVLFLAWLISGCHGPDWSESPSSQGIDGSAAERQARAQSNRGTPHTVQGIEVRTMDGASNNLTHPEWGASFTHLSRWADADYVDGYSEPAGATRPSPRVISNALHHQDDGVSIPNPMRASDFLWQWGQFIDHDIGLTDGAAEYWPITVPSGDDWFDPAGTGSQVIPFTRAFYDHATGTTTPREQQNQITAWIDGSMVYGSSDERAEALRDVGGRLKTSPGDLLPFNTEGLVNANGPVREPSSLFLAGDVRANEQTGLAVMHTLFVREHNRWVDVLARLQPSATEDELYHQARRLVVAEIQKVTYDEFLPALIGRNALPHYGGYRATVKPGLFNEFSVAAFRLGHSMVNETVLRIDESGTPIPAGPLGLRESFFAAPTFLRNSSDLEPILRGLAAQVHQRLDLEVVNPLRNFLFGPPGQGGLDLVSLNIQRGRDHGVPSYLDMREAMGLPELTNIDQITKDPAVRQALRDTYGNIENIDLWVGGLAEDPLLSQGSQVGPLLRAMVARQFEALRDGDRFWHKMDLTGSEYNLVRHMTLAKIIRLNTDIDKGIPDDVFHVPRGCEPYVQFNNGDSVRVHGNHSTQVVIQFGNRGGAGTCSNIDLRCRWQRDTITNVSAWPGPFSSMQLSGDETQYATFERAGGLRLPQGQNHNVAMNFRASADGAFDCVIREGGVEAGSDRIEVDWIR